MSNQQILKVAGIWDFHYPQNIPYDALLKYMQVWKPQQFILGGDIWSLDCISHWNDADFKNVGFDTVRATLHAEATGLRCVLDAFARAMPAARFTYIVGNHEHWIQDFTQKYPQMDDLSLDSLLGLRKRRVTIIPFGKTYQIGKLFFKHGHEYGSDNPAKQAVIRGHHSVVFGHHHSYKVWTDFSDLVEDERHVGILVPCFCKRAPDYQKGRPNAWVNGFFYANIKPNGNYCAGVQNVSPRGNFILQSGVEYRV